MVAPIQILSTKTLTENQRKELIAANFEVLEKDFIQVEAISFDTNNIQENLIFTSQNAVHSFLNHANIDTLKNKNVFCVGMKSKEILEEKGFPLVAYTDYAEDLAEIITLIYSNESFTFFTGNLRKDTLPAILKSEHVVFNEIQVYETQLTPHLITEPLDAILFYSPSGIESYLKKNKIKNEICFCIGETTASRLENITKNIIIADYPSIEALITTCIEEYQ